MTKATRPRAPQRVTALSIPEPDPAFARARRSLRIRGFLRASVGQFWIGITTSVMIWKIAERWLSGPATLAVVTASLLLTVFVRIATLPFDRKIDLIRKEGTRDRQRLVFHVISHFHRFVAREVADANRARRTTKPAVLEQIVRRREGQAGAPYLAAVVERVRADCGFATPGGFDQLFGGSVLDVRTAVDNYLRARLSSVRSAGPDGRSASRDGDTRARSTELQSWDRLAQHLARRSHLLENADVVFFAYLICITPGTQRGLLKLFDGLLVYEDANSRRQLLDIVSASSRGMLVKLTGIDVDTLSSIDAAQARQLIELYASATTSLARSFKPLLDRRAGEPVLVVVIGYSSAVSACIARAGAAIGQVIVAETADPKADEQMIAELAGLGATVGRGRIADLPRMPTRHPLVLFGFEAVTPELEFVDPRRTIADAVSALRAAGSDDAEVFAIGEHWKIRPLIFDAAATHQQSVYRASGVPRLITPDGDEIGTDAVRARLHRDMQRWSMAVRTSLARIAPDDDAGGVMVKLDLRPAHAVGAHLDLVG